MWSSDWSKFFFPEWQHRKDTVGVEQADVLDHSSFATLPSITPWKKHTWHLLHRLPSPSHPSRRLRWEKLRNGSQNQTPCCSLALEGPQGLDPLCSQWATYFPAFPPLTFISYHYPHLNYTARSPKALSCCLATPSIHSMQNPPGMNKPRVTKAVHSHSFPAQLY